MAGMTPGRQIRPGSGPQRFTPRASSKMPGAVRRALDGQIVSSQRNGETIEVKDGRLEARVVRGGGLKQTRQGLVVDQEQVGEKNRPQLNRTAVPSTVSAAALHRWATDLVEELRRTGRMRG